MRFTREVCLKASEVPAGIGSFNAKEVYTGVAFNNTAAKKLYQSSGFELTGEADEFQSEMKLKIED